MEQTLSELQAQIDRLNAALTEWRATQDDLGPMAQRLSQLAERWAEIMNRSSQTDERHAHAVSEVEARLVEWSAIETRLEQDSLQRIREFEATIEQEWKTIKELHEEPVKQLREQAAALGETCVAAANLALRGFERAEARFASLEADLQMRLTQVSHELQAGLAEIKTGLIRPGQGPASDVAAFPLEGVMRIHSDLRGSARPTAPEDAHEPAGGETDRPRPWAQVIERNMTPEPVPVSGRVESRGEPLVTPPLHATDRARPAPEPAGASSAGRAPDSAEQRWRTIALALGGVAILATLGGLVAQQRLASRIDATAAQALEAERRAATASEAATQQLAATRTEADRQIADARAAAARADLVTAVLSAPDLLRFNLVAPDSISRAEGQAQWSRSHGLVFSASGLAPVSGGQTYQIWLLSNASAISLTTFAPDASGRCSLAVKNPPTVPRPVNGVLVTLEPASGSPFPSASVVLAKNKS